MIGQSIAHFEITAKIGEGGMGEVYQATDTRLNRQVALKILPQVFAQDKQRMGRFEREAQVLASLNHPNIAAIHGLEEANGTKALVMELVEGEDLSERIARGPIPLDEALRIALQIAEALEDAHEKGIIHRDLKPANIKLTPEGKVKILDFGLAKALEKEGAKADSSDSPTLTLQATQAGIILGTAAYMSPEQAKGKGVDRRADIWAFGAILYEMLTGQKAFQGEDLSDTLAAVLKSEVNWAALDRATPIRIFRLVRRCLERQDRQRLRDIGEARIAIEDYLSGSPEDSPVDSTRAVAAQPLWRGLVPWTGTAIFVLAFLALLWALWPTESAPQPLRRLDVKPSPGVTLTVDAGTGPAAVLSPDESMLAFVGEPQEGGARRIYVRRLDQPEATELPGTEGVRHPVFSPDGQWIAFRADGKLKKISVRGGAAVTLCDTGLTRGLEWIDDGSLVFASARDRGLSRVSSSGGDPEPLTSLEEDEFAHRWPQVLPGGETVLFTAVIFDEDPRIVAQRIGRQERKVVWPRGYFARYLPSGHLVYVYDGTLFAAAFDPETLAINGQTVPVVDNVWSSSFDARAEVAFSEKGTLIFVSRPKREITWALEWLDGEGNRESLLSESSRLSGFQLSPDGRRLALAISDDDQLDIWIYECERETLGRFTFSMADDLDPVWSPDGGVIAFASDRDGATTMTDLYWKRADGTGEVHRLTEGSNRQRPHSWHPSGQFLAFVEANDIRILALEGDDRSGWKAAEAKNFLAGSFIEASPAFSPDGRWLAYESDESGRFEIYVRPFPGRGGKWQISSDGGMDPTWSPDGKELFYVQDGQILTVSCRVDGDSFVGDKPQKWGEGEIRGPLRIRGIGEYRRSYDLHPDGRRVVVRQAASEGTEQDLDHVVLIENFFDYLKQQVPTDQ